MELLVLALLGSVPTDARPYVWPVLPPSVVRAFDPPEQPWLPGHRGIDLAGGPGTAVRAMGAGTVVFSGEVAGIGVVTIDHGRFRSTYQPVQATAPVGSRVDAGAVIGVTSPTGGHCAGACLHLGVVAEGGYRDPLPLLLGSPVLKPRPLPGARPWGGSG